MRRLIVLLALVAGACTAAPTTAADPTTTLASPTPSGHVGRVDRVPDGDSMWIVLDGAPVEIRLLGINAPEEGECWADEARLALLETATGRRLTVVGEERDRFDRLLAYVYDGTETLNQVMVEGGHALAVTVEHDLLAGFLAAEEDAVTLGRGLWSPQACGPPLGDHGIKITDVEPDAPGRDETNPNGEYVAIANDGPGDADLAGWMLRDESSSHRFAFPTGFELAAGSVVTVHSGCGADEPLRLHWCAETPVWNNAGDTVLLLAPSGTVAQRFRYEGD